MPNRLRINDTISRRSFLKTTLAAGMFSAGLLCDLSLCGCKSEIGDEIFRGTRTITDDAGRELKIPTPNELKKVYFTSPLAQIYVFTLKPEVQAGTCSSFSKEELEYLPDNMAGLINMGSLSMGGEIDREMLMQQGVQLVFSISGVELSASNISDANELQDQTNIPVVLVDGSFDKIKSAYELVGDILGEESRAKEIAEYLDKIYTDVTKAISTVKDEDKVSVYYAEGPTGQSTEPETSQHAKAFQVAGARNVAKVDVSASGFGMSSVSLEQIIKWNPEIIITWDQELRGGAASYIRQSKDWASIKAVQNGRVYEMPNLPFAWLDRPNGVQRWLGIQWLANMMYPDKYDVDMVQESIKFYKLVYNIDLSEEKAKIILGNSYPVYKK